MYKKNSKSKQFDKSRGGKTDKSSNYKQKRGNYNSASERDANSARSKRYNEEDVKGKTDARNDTSWYGGQSELMAQAAALSFGNALGMEPQLISNYDAPANKKVASNADLAVPGIMCFDVLPVFGECKDWNSPANLAARTIYSYVRHANSGHSNYDASDLGMYIMAMDQLYSFYGWMTRLYGTMQTILTRNRYLPKAVVMAQGGNYDDLAKNLADFLFYINVFASRLNSMSVPNTYSLFKRHMWLFSNIYADADTDKCQMYVLRPAGFAKYNPVASDNGPELQWMPVNIPGDTVVRPTMSLDMIKAMGDELMNAVLNDEDMNIISGDILKAYGDNRFMVAGVSPDYKCVPIYEPEFLLQIHNAMHIDSNVIAMPNIVQDVKEGSPSLGCLKFQPSIEVEYSTAMSSPMDHYYRSDISALVYSNIIDLTTNVANSNLIAIATRFKFTPKLTTIQENAGNVKKVKVDITNFASELIIGAWLLWMPRSDSDSGARREIMMYPLYPRGTTDGRVAPNGFNIGQSFDSRPIMYDVSLNFDETTGNLISFIMNGVAGSLTNFTTINSTTLENIQLCAMQAMVGLL